MATPEEEKKKKEQEQQQSYVDKFAEDTRNATQNYVQGINDSAEAAVNSMAEANKAFDQDVADVLIRLGEEARQAKKEQQVLSNMEASRAKWAAVTEAASALSNLVGVGSFNSSNQQQHQFSADWMKDADTKRQQREARLDSIKANLDQMRMRSSQLKAGNAAALAKLRQEAAEKATKAQYDTETAVAAAQLKKGIADEEAARDMEMLEKKQAFTASESAKDRRSREIIYGNRDSGGGSRSDIALTLPADANGGPKETIYIKPGSISATLAAGIDSITDLSEEDKANLELDVQEGGSNEARRDRILPFVTKSKQLRALLRDSGSSNTTSEEAAPEATPQAAAPAAPAESPAGEEKKEQKPARPRNGAEAIVGFMARRAAKKASKQAAPANNTQAPAVKTDAKGYKVDEFGLPIG